MHSVYLCTTVHTLPFVCCHTNLTIIMILNIFYSLVGLRCSIFNQTPNFLCWIQFCYQNLGVYFFIDYYLCLLAFKKNVGVWGNSKKCMREHTLLGVKSGLQTREKDWISVLLALLIYYSVIQMSEINLFFLLTYL